MASQLGVEPPLVIQGQELREEGFGGQWVWPLEMTPGVGKAAEYLPATHPLWWVGKGIVYDIGGLSIKGQGLYASYNVISCVCVGVCVCVRPICCGGAAAVLGAFDTA